MKFYVGQPNFMNLRLSQDSLKTFRGVDILRVPKFMNCFLITRFNNGSKTPTPPTKTVAGSERLCHFAALTY